jgi:hypothetical protein
VVSGDERFKEAFDVTAGRIPIEEIMEHVHQDYVEMGWAALEAALKAVVFHPGNDIGRRISVATYHRQYESYSTCVSKRKLSAKNAGRASATGILCFLRQKLI